MHPLDPHGWDYNGQSIRPVLELLEAIAFSCKEADIEKITNAFVAGGGKAFGLELCELVAKYDGRFRVPRWQYLNTFEITEMARSFSPIRSLDNLQTDHVVLRSSDRTEDWRDGSAGGLVSQEAKTEEIPAYLGNVWQRCQPIVVQEHVSGVGIVVDIGYSVLLDQLVIRTATGRDWYNKTQRRFTSATADKEGLHNLFNAFGEPLVRGHHGKLWSDKVHELPCVDIATRLLQAVQSLGITFGVQFELVVHPDVPDVWHLVQIRPSPLQVRSLMREFRATGKPLTTTPVVNKSFRCSGEIVTVNNQAKLYGLCRELPVPREIITQYADKIALWEDEPHQDFGVFAMETLARIGVLGQISRGVVMVNTTHSTVRNDHPVHAEAWHSVNSSQAILGINESAFKVLCQLAHHTKTRVELVSDGLVGQIYSAP